jgi:hypothetical protein
MIGTKNAFHIISPTSGLQLLVWDEHCASNARQMLSPFQTKSLLSGVPVSNSHGIFHIDFFRAMVLSEAL